MHPGTVDPDHTGSIPFTGAGFTAPPGTNSVGGDQSSLNMPFNTTPR